MGATAAVAGSRRVGLWPKRRPMARVRSVLPILAACALAAPAADGQIYRWSDADGRQRFTTDLQQVPPDQRESAKQGGKPGGSVNFHSGDERPPQPEAAPGPAAAAGPGAASDADCARLKKQARAKLRDIGKKERRVERYEDAADDIARSDYARRRSEVKLEAARAELDRARTDYEAFRSAARRDEVDPGCLR